jgi:hypothetical protein
MTDAKTVLTYFRRTHPGRPLLGGRCQEDALADALADTLYRAERAEARVEALEQSDETAWGVIANGIDWGTADDGTPCGDKAATWRRAAKTWRDARHARRAALAQEVPDD